MRSTAWKVTCERWRRKAVLSANARRRRHWPADGPGNSCIGPHRRRCRVLAKGPEWCLRPRTWVLVREGELPGDGPDPGPPGRRRAGIDHAGGQRCRRGRLDRGRDQRGSWANKSRYTQWLIRSQQRSRAPGIGTAHLPTPSDAAFGSTRAPVQGSTRGWRGTVRVTSRH